MVKISNHQAADPLCVSDLVICEMKEYYVALKAGVIEQHFNS